ncbi:MAG TPA: hypothetical protein VJX94_31495 [Stellaceae bacterium]|nr:hypothetical protein [Stellaceae bacterium]
MSLDADQIYSLLPAIHRTRDAAAGGPSQALVGVIAEQVGVLEQDLTNLYADQFIETCAPWVIPYIGDLIGWTGLVENIPNGARARADVANTMGYRRRKGTVIALEQAGHDVTGRPVHIVEYFRRLAVNQSFRHLRLHHASFVNLRHGAALTRIGGPFDTLSRTVDVRRIPPRVRTPNIPDNAALDIALHGEGRYNISDIGAWVWRWISFPVTGQPATVVDARRFLASPLGNDMPLFNAPPVRASFQSLTTRADVPQPIGRREFHDDPNAFYGASNGLVIYVNGVPVGLETICVCDLSDFLGGWAPAPAGKVAIDPVLGRIVFADDLPAPATVTLDYNYGFPAELGGGPYDRTQNLTLDRTQITWSQVVGAGATDIFGVPITLEAAVALFNAQPAGTVGVIVLADFLVADIDLTGTRRIVIPSGSTLWIIAAQVLPDGTWAPSRARATLRGNIEIDGAGTPPGGTPGQLFCNGPLIAGAMRAQNGAVAMTLQDCTLVPGKGLTRDGQPLDPDAPAIVMQFAGSTLVVNNCIVGPLLVQESASARVTSTFVDALARWRVAYAGPDGAGEGGTLQVEDSTIIGKVRTHRLPLASNTIFLARRALRHDAWEAAIWCTRRQSGCVRFCFVPADAITPGQYRCLPGTDPELEDALAQQFVSLRYGSPSYGLLGGDCPVAVWQGADDESQIGAYHLLYETQGVGNLRSRMDEYLPFGLEAGIFLVPSREERLIAELPYGYGGRSRPRSALLENVDALFGISIGAALI